jgi:peroxiredoxin
MKPTMDLNKEQDMQLAPDFTLPDIYGQAITLSNFQAEKFVVLVLNRGFM